MAKSLCIGCRYFEKITATNNRGVSNGECRRNPPSIDLGSDDESYGIGKWPRIQSNQWCGEHESEGDDFPL